jgi:thymidine kinase
MEETKCGTIKLILGCMFSGKTSELQREYYELSSINKKILCINYSADNRYGSDGMYNHNGERIDCFKAEKLSDVHPKLIDENEIILINEGQFFPDLVEYCQSWCEDYGKNIIVCGLDGDYKRKPFGRIPELMSIADDFIKLTAYCKGCNDLTKAIFTHRKSSEEEQIVIGANNYEALCRKCYLSKSRDRDI